MMKKKCKIALDVGHTSGRDQGASSYCGLTEHGFWSKWCGAVQQRLEQAGAEVRVFKREQFGGSVARECVGVNSWGADVAVSLHLNSAENKSAAGHEVIYISPTGYKLAMCIDAALDTLGGLKDRNCRTPYQGRGEVWLTQTRAPAVIVEPAFLSNLHDVEFLKNNARELAHAIADGILGYFHAKR